MKNNAKKFFLMILIFFNTNIISTNEHETIVNEIRCVKEKLYEINEIIAYKSRNVNNRKYFFSLDRQKSTKRRYCAQANITTDYSFTSVVSIQDIKEFSSMVKDLKEYLKTNPYKNFDFNKSDIFSKKMLDIFNSLLNIVSLIDCTNKDFNLKKEELNTYVCYLIDKYKTSLNLNCCGLLLGIYFFTISKFLIQIEILIVSLQKN
ncbi:hypothetical protein CWI39_1498p0020 [Hamiltosporidium magnivora]|uniref:Uncharacterized protein n=1 Tax=Hamiltosporidium magnivora TaxID=148818 RepID=A0A4Q9L2H0_9MICR|nr:hypothetical protein CWI39_1498p0020 [Hamiltosporidium magnivora]